MAAEDTRRTMEAYVQDLLGGPYKRHFSDDVVVSLVGTDQGAQGPDDAEAWIDYLHTQAFEARPELKSMIVSDGQARRPSSISSASSVASQPRVGR